jgi:sulfonate transport system ATP-binding protein
MLTVTNLAKRFSNGHLALAGIDLVVGPGEILGVVGASGCGKSTLLRLISGLEVPTEGRVEINGTAVTGPRPEVGFVFQEPRLMPWLSIDDNVEFGIRHLPKAERVLRVGETLARVGLGKFAGHWPRELSGGMAQRAALARALVGRPEILLLDEPFSALDALTRYDLQEHVLELWAYDRPTMVLVTHDIEEALALSDRVVVMQSGPGRVQITVAPPLPRPRNRAGLEFQEWKEKLLAELHLSFKAARQGDERFPAAAI